MARPPIDEVEGDPLPVVAGQGRGLPTWSLVLFAVAAALLLFGVLDARRRSAEVPSVAPRGVDTEDAASSLPPLAIPAEPAPLPVTVVPVPAALPSTGQAAPLGSIARYPARPTPVPFVPPSQSLPRAVESIRPTTSTGTAVVVDNSAAQNGTDGRGNNAVGDPSSTAGGARVRASMLANRTTTVPQGTLIQAVLETGFDSSRPGFARASVSRDVRGFDGQRVLIPRGSRLIGEYKSDERAGQKRALIIWERLIRPDGATIEIGSPAADTVGRGGIKADVNTHFFERFSGAILQSALNAGVNIASQQAGGSVVVALPNAGLAGSSVIQPTNIPPTLKVKPGTSVSVFVAHDLDFTDVEDHP